MAERGQQASGQRIENLRQQLLNDWTTDDVKKNMNAWKEANKDKLIN